MAFHTFCVWFGNFTTILGLRIAILITIYVDKYWHPVILRIARKCSAAQHSVIEGWECFFSKYVCRRLRQVVCANRRRLRQAMFAPIVTHMLMSTIVSFAYFCAH